MESQNLVSLSICKDNNLCLMYTLNKESPLTDCIEDVCKSWKIKDPENYSLVLFETVQDETKCQYITEEYKEKLVESSILHLYPTPSKLAQKLVKEMEKQDGHLSETLSTILVFLEDSCFSVELVKNQGVTAVSNLIENNSDLKPDQLQKLLNCLIQLLEGNPDGFSELNEQLITRMISIVNSTEVTNTSEQLVVINALNFLELIMNNPKLGQKTVFQSISYDSVLNLVKSSFVDVQHSALSFIITSFLVAPEHKKFNLAKGELKNLRPILHKIITSGKKDQMDVELSNLLKSSQKIICGEVSHYMKKSPSSDIELCVRMFENLKNALSDITDSKSGAQAVNLKTIGFLCESINPEAVSSCLKFRSGLATLNNIKFMIQHHSDDFLAAIHYLQQKSSAFLSLADACTTILFNFFLPTEKDGGYEKFCPLLFSIDNAIESCFCILMLHYTKICSEHSGNWSEIEPSLRGIIEREFSPATRVIEDFRKFLNDFASAQMFSTSLMGSVCYSDMSAQFGPVIEYRTKVIEKVKNTMDRHRIAFMKRGILFYTQVYRGKLKDPMCYVLSEDEKFIHYGPSSTLQPYSKFLDKVIVKNYLVTADTTGGQTQNDRGRDNQMYLDATIFVTVGKEKLKLIAENLTEKKLWLDGIDVLQQKVKSQNYEKDQNALVSLILMATLVDLHDVRVPNTSPEIPQPPPNYDYYYKFTTDC